MKVLRRQKVEKFKRLDDDIKKRTRRSEEEEKKEAKQSGKSSKKFVVTSGVKQSVKSKSLSKSKYSPLDGAFPVESRDDDNNERRFDVVFDDVRQDVVKSEEDAEHRFDAVFDDVPVREGKSVDVDTLAGERQSELKLQHPSIPNTEATSCATSCATSSASSWVSFFEKSNTPSHRDDTSTNTENYSDGDDAGSREESTTSNPPTPTTVQSDVKSRISSKSFLKSSGTGGKKKSAYEKLDCSPEVQTELDERLGAIQNLKDIVIKQSKRIRTIQLSNKAYRIRLKVFQEEMSYLQLQRADLEERVTKLEDDLRIAKADAFVSKEEADRMCTALVLIRQEINEFDKRAEALNVSSIGDLFAEQNESSIGEPDISTNNDDNDFVFDAFNLHEEDATTTSNNGKEATEASAL